MKLYFFLAICLGLGSAASGQRVADSLARENLRLNKMVDSLRRSADHQDTIIQSLHRMVELMGKDSSNKEAMGWNRTYGFEMAKFDSTLVRLDSCLGLLNASNEQLKAAGKNKKGGEK
jgi:hypothetical protein